MSMKGKVISALILISFIGAGVFSFTHALDMTKGGHHAGNCPIMAGQEVICNLNPISHLTTWQKATTFNPEAYILLILILSTLSIVWTFRFFSNNHSPPRPSVLKIAYAQLPVDLYTRIFSDGLLNSKAY